PVTNHYLHESPFQHELRIPNPESRQVYSPLAGACGVGVWPPLKPAPLFSTDARMSRTLAPDVYISRACVATAMQTVHSRPCGSHAVTSPFSSRACTKQSSLPRWPPRSQPQKHGT